MRDDGLLHIGMPRRSGRYPWGSGENPYQHNADFLKQVREMKAAGKTEQEIAESMGMKTTEFRRKHSIYVNAEAYDKIMKATKLREKGYALQTIGGMFNPPINESSVRVLLKRGEKLKEDICINTMETLAENVASKKFVDVGTGVELSMGIKRTRMDVALQMLEEKGYNVYSVRVPQINNPGKYTTVKVLCEPGVEWKDAQKNAKNIKSIDDYSHDGGDTFWAPEYPSSISSSRVMIRYGDKGGIEKDGVIELRRGVPDLDLGDSHYAQVRIGVDGTHYLKGMAIYSDNMPKGVDVIFNTNKESGTPKE